MSRLTKADLLTPEQLAGADATPTSGFPCTGCGMVLHTEGAVARHFTINDRRYPNLGECPRKEAAKQRAVKQGRRPLFIGNTFLAPDVEGHVREYRVTALFSDGAPRSWGWNAPHHESCACSNPDW